MSGIFGVAMKSGKNVSASLRALEKANAIYGRDGSDHLTADSFALGCHLEHFAQDFLVGTPVMKEDGCIAVMDTLLFNRDELLPMAGLPENTPDEALLFRLIRQKGPEVLKKVNGDFAGVIYEPEKRRWLIFRDQTGVRPLYVYCKDDTLAFSTDIRGILMMPGLDLSVDERQLYVMLMGGNTNTAHATYFAHIRMLEAGHYAWITEEENSFAWEKIAYYVPGGEKIRLCSRRAYEKRLYALMEDAVNRRLKVVPGLVGAELSGGLDSTVIDVFINRAGRAAKYLSWSPSLEENPLQEDDERILIDQLCRQEHIECAFLPVDRRTRLELLERPLPPHAHTLRVGDTAEWMSRQGVRVVFSGHGGDEGASHRMSINELWHHGEYFAYARELFHRLKGRKLRLARTAVRLLRQAKAGKHYVRSWWAEGGNNKALLADDFYARMKAEPLPPLGFGYAPESFVAAGGQRSRVDNAAFQAAEYGVRYLFPLMDARVMSFALGIPRRMFLKHGQNRLIYRKAFEQVLPHDICWQLRKDSPGMMGIERPDNMTDYEQSMCRILDEMDQQRWSRYWNPELLRQMKGRNKAQEDALPGWNANSLYICWLIQQWQDGRWKYE